MANTLFNFFNLFPAPEPVTDRLPETTIQIPTKSDFSFETEVFDIVNGHRTSLRLPPLRSVSGIADIAKKHSQWLCDTAYWGGEIGHSGFLERAEQVRKLGFQEIRENLGTAQVLECHYKSFQSRRSITELMLAEWIASTRGHREAIEECESTHTGVGVVSHPAYDENGNSGFVIYVTQLFARLR